MSLKYFNRIFKIRSFEIIYRPEDLDVKVENNQLVISAKQETKEAGGGTRTRVFEQKFSLPPGVDPASVKSNLTRDNVLVVTAAKEGYHDRTIKESYVDTKALNINPEELVIEIIENTVVEEVDCGKEVSQDQKAFLLKVNLFFLSSFTTIEAKKVQSSLWRLWTGSKPFIFRLAHPSPGV